MLKTERTVNQREVSRCEGFAQGAADATQRTEVVMVDESMVGWLVDESMVGFINQTVSQ